MTNKWARVIALSLVVSFLMALAPAVAGGDGDPDATSGPIVRPQVGSVQRNALVEVFTNYGCPPCTVSDPAMVRLMDEYEEESAVFLSWHVWWPDSSDPFYNSNSVDLGERTNYYK